MPSLIVFAQLTTAGIEARQTVLDMLSKVSVYAKQNEPETLRYAIAIPRSASDEKTVYVLEEYASQAAFDAHMAAKPTTDLIANFGANSMLFSGETDVCMAEPSSTFVRSGVTKSEDPFITYASIDYREGTRNGALDGWKTVTAETQKNEPDTLSYTIATDKANGLTIKTLEVYANEKYFREVHAPSKAVAENKAKYGDEIRMSIKHVFLKLVAGYLHKDKTGSNL